MTTSPVITKLKELEADFNGVAAAISGTHKIRNFFFRDIDDEIEAANRYAAAEYPAGMPHSAFAQLRMREVMGEVQATADAFAEVSGKASGRLFGDYADKIRRNRGFQKKIADIVSMM